MLHRASLYLPYKCEVDVSDRLKWIQKTWIEIEFKKIRNPADQFRCIFFSKLIQLYCDSILTKAQLVQEFNLFDTSYSLKVFGIQNGALNVHLLASLLKLWQAFQ